MAVYEIPLTPAPQSFEIVLSGRLLKLFARWLESPAPDAPGGWYLDIYDAPDDLEPVILGIPLVCGCDLLEPYKDKGLNGGLFVSGDLPPTLENLGTETLLLFETANE